MPKRNLAWILVITMITLLMWQLPQIIAGRDAVYQAFGPLVDARSQIRRRFVQELDDSELVGAAVESGIRAMVERLEDPHAVYFSEAEYERFRKRTEGRFGGIGVDVWSVDEGLEVLSRARHSPAMEAGLQIGDVITHIDGRSIRGVPLVEAVNNQLNGAPDTPVTLTIQGKESGHTRDVTIERKEIHIDPVRGWSRSASGEWRYMLDPELRVGYVRLTKFTANVDSQLDSVMERLLRSQLRGLILDLRENTGGLLDSAREVADRFLESGLIVRVSGRRTDEKQWFAMRDGTYPDFAMAVLVDGMTASAAEIVAGALRDHQRAAVVGERTYGKGSVQEVFELDNHCGAIKLTTAFYYLPCGECIHRSVRAKGTEAAAWGVAPTLPVNLTDRQRTKWLAMWRELARETPDPMSRPASQPSEEVERTQAAKTLLDVDLQLARALEYLRGRIVTTTQPAASRPAETRQSAQLPVGSGS